MGSAKLKTTTAFTLIEMMVAIGIGMVVLAAVTTTFISQTRYYNSQEQVNEMEQNARGAIDIMSREIKMAGYDPQSAGFTKFTTFTSTQVSFQADLDGNGIPSTASSDNEQITYNYDSANRQITRAVGSAPAEVLADNIESLAFAYYQSNGTTTATSSTAIRQVKITLTARTSKLDPNYTANNGYRTYQVIATITPNNLAL